MSNTRIGAGVIVLLIVVTAVWWWDQAKPKTPLAEAMDRAPAAAERFNFTHWAALRTELDVAEGDTSTLLDKAFRQDLSTTSSLTDSGLSMKSTFGFSPATIEWEVLAQAPKGQVSIVKVSEEVVEKLPDTLKALGYTQDEEQEDVWGGQDALARADPTLAPILSYFAFPGDNLIVLGDNNKYVKSALKAAEGKADTAYTGEVAEAADALEEPLVASVLTDGRVCTELSMTNAGEDDQSAANELVRAAGDTNPITTYAVAVYGEGESRSVRALMSFANDRQAQENADTRAELAAGPALGQGGEYADRFSVDSVSTEGKFVSIDATLVEGGAALSDLTVGPVLLATC